VIATLRWIGWILLADMALLVAIFVGLFAAKSVGIDIQNLKWPTVFYSGILIMLLIPLAASWLMVRGIVFLRGRKSS
jgi:hypothetical protein